VNTATRDLPGAASFRSFEPLAAELGIHHRHAGQIAAGVRQGRGEAIGHGIGNDRHDDRDRRCRVLDRLDRLRAGGDDDVRIGRDQLRRELPQLLHVTFRLADDNRDIPAGRQPDIT